MLNQKKPFYKKWWFILIAVFFILAALGALQDSGEIEDKQAVEKTEKTEESKNVAVNADPEPTIDTSVFEYATAADVTDAIDINKHVTVKLNVSDDAAPGMAAQDVLKQSFKFLQQDDIKGAETVTIFITQKEKKIFQFTVNKNEFKPNETDPVGGLVLEASEVEMMSDEVEKFGKAMEWPI